MLAFFAMGLYHGDKWEQVKWMYRKAKNFGQLIGKIMTPGARRRGFSEAYIYQNWQHILPIHAAYTRPLNLFKGVLSLAVPSDSAKVALQMESPLLIEQINTFFGYTAVQRLRFVLRQFPLEDEAKNVSLNPDTGAQIRAKARCEGIKDDGLRKQLEKLGALVEMDNVKGSEK